MTRRHHGEGSIYPVKDGYRGYVWCTNPAGIRYRKYVKGKTTRPPIKRGSSSGTRQAADRSAPTYRSSPSSSPTGSRKSSRPTSHLRHTRNMRLLPGCISSRISGVSDSTSSR